jgi:hypothetical protein
MSGEDLTCRHGRAFDVHCCACGRSGFHRPHDCDCYDDEDDGEEDEFDCHRTGDGGCELAGTEECEFECPYREEGD